MPEPAPHTLVIGGTGMLRGVCLDLAGRGQTVFVVARDSGRLDGLAAAARQAGGRIEPRSVNYADSHALRNAITACGMFDPIRLAVCWVHDSAPEAVRMVAEFMSKQAKRSGGEPPRLFHILGSSSLDAASLVESGARLSVVPHIAYRTILLGCVQGDNGSRWLTHEEICRGVLEAIDSDAPESIVGCLSPRSAIPH